MGSLAAVGAFQASLLDVVAPGGDPNAVELGDIAGPVERTTLGDGAWVDLRRGWVLGSDALFSHLEVAVPWRSERRRMFDRVVDVPRLVRHYDEGSALPDKALDSMLEELSRHYSPEYGEPLRSVGMCL